MGKSTFVLLKQLGAESYLKSNTVERNNFFVQIFQNMEIIVLIRLINIAATAFRIYFAYNNWDK